MTSTTTTQPEPRRHPSCKPDECRLMPCCNFDYSPPCATTSASSDVLDSNAIGILQILADQEPECKSSLSDMVRMLWDDYCESYGEQDVEIG